MMMGIRKKKMKFPEMKMVCNIDTGGISTREDKAHHYW